FVSIADGCVFFVLQDPNAANQQVFRVDPTTGTRTQISTGGLTSNVMNSGCNKAAWTVQVSNNPTNVQYWDGTTVTTLATDAGTHYNTKMARGQIVYTQKVNNIQQVFVVDTNTTPLTPVQLSAETDATKYL